jgi:hypothetical protein
MKIKNQIKINFFKNNIINIYILYFLFCILSALINFNDIKNNILELYFIIIFPVIFFLILLSNLSKKKIIFIYVLTILFISFVAILFIIPNFYNIDYFFNLRNAPIYNPELYLLGVNTIKSTGISRLLLIIYIFFFVKILFKNNYRYKILTILFLLNILIFLFESRTSFYFLLLINFLIFFSKNFKKFYFKTIIFLILSLIGNFTFSFNQFLINKELISTRYSILFNENANLKKSTEENANLNLEKSTEENKRLIISYKTSGRTDIWNKLFEKEKSPLILGYGIERDKSIFGMTISNGALYSYISGGIVGLFCYSTIVLFTVKNIFFFLYKRKKQLLKINNFYPIVSIIVLIFLILRSLVETSFIFFGIDMILFIISNILISYKLEK